MFRCAARKLGSVPNKGYRTPAKVPDRLRDAFSYFSSDARRFNTDDAPFLDEQKRQGLMRDVLSLHKNMQSLAKLDRLKLTLDEARFKPPSATEWDTVAVLLRTMELSVEIVPDPSDVFPKGEKLWIDLSECTERRRPYCIELEDGTVVLPVFSFEEYANHYFQRLKEFEACWFPVPRAGTQAAAFDEMKFPVMAHGPIKKIAALATMSVPNGQFVLLVNPFLPSSKFVTFQEMLNLAKATDEHGNVVPSSDALRRAFNTTKWNGKRIDALRVPRPPPVSHAASLALPPLPHIARGEMRLLLFDQTAIREVRLRLVDKSVWQRMTTPTSVGHTMTELVVVLHPEPVAQRAEIEERILTWSYLREVPGQVLVSFVEAAMVGDAASPTASDWGDVVYSEKEALLLRASAHRTGPTLREMLNYEAPLEASAATPGEPRTTPARAPWEHKA